jgi:hypothetical protein
MIGTAGNAGTDAVQLKLPGVATTSKQRSSVPRATAQATGADGVQLKRKLGAITSEQRSSVPRAMILTGGANFVIDILGHPCKSMIDNANFKRGVAHAYT